MNIRSTGTSNARVLVISRAEKQSGLTNKTLFLR